jgi:hypothetical protein
MPRSDQTFNWRSQAMYPTLVIALVARETSVLEECALGTRASGILTFPSMQFAAPSSLRANAFLTTIHFPEDSNIIRRDINSKAEAENHNSSGFCTEEEV